jgi:hypothetical protein
MAESDYVAGRQPVPFRNDGTSLPQLLTKADHRRGGSQLRVLPAAYCSAISCSPVIDVDWAHGPWWSDPSAGRSLFQAWQLVFIPRETAPVHLLCSLLSSRETIRSLVGGVAAVLRVNDFGTSAIVEELAANSFLAFSRYILYWGLSRRWRIWCLVSPVAATMSL